MRRFLAQALTAALAVLLASGPAAAELARLPKIIDLPVAAPSAAPTSVAASPAAPEISAALPTLPTLPALPALPAALPALPAPAAQPQQQEQAPRSAEQAASAASASFDGSGDGPRRGPRGALTTAVLRGIGLTTALSAATEPWRSMHPVWVALGLIPVAAGLALGFGRISLRDPATDRPIVPAPKMSLKQSAKDVWIFLRKKKETAPPQAIRRWRYLTAIKGFWPTLRLAGPGVWFATTGLRIAANATLAAWFSNPAIHIAGRVVQVAGLALAAFSAYFYRDPQRPAAAFGPDDVASPADGRVLSVRSEKPGEVTIRIFLSALNVHVQRAPFEGKVTDMTYVKGKFVVASAPEAAAKNERNSTRIEGKDGRWAVVDQLTGFVARRIATWVERGDAVAQGQRTGMIFFGSQVAVHLPASANVLVKPGDKVAGGRSILARF